ncbi:VOC family protein [Streptomyces beijiangensis]|uniref:VOC family protein n=1 Tax=Streptomyces beijiangensis TaxID=163361 RepID=A0A939JIE2_9ACTN|nr:VOC family protein [Streptomyces beijiangensis]MBO0513602.1 VOC family protein [Streptomyces beijiangensis]
MSRITSNQPDSTPTWIDLCVPDLKQAQDFYRAVFGWEYEPASKESGSTTLCLLDGEPVAGLREGDPQQWLMYFATGDCDALSRRIADTGGSLVQGPADLGTLARTAVAVDAVGAPFGLWEGRDLPGCAVVNEPDSLVRNDLITPDPGPARAFYTALLGFTLDANEAMPELDFTFLRRPDGHEIGGIIGAPGAARSGWHTMFEVTDTDAVAARANGAGGVSGPVSDFLYGRRAEITDPFGTVFEVIARPATS